MIMFVRHRTGIKTTTCWIFFVTFFCVPPSACSRQKEKGTLEIQIKDHVALSFSVNPGEVTKIILDLAVTDMSDHPPRAYELQLVGYAVYANGKMITRIPPA